MEYPIMTIAQWFLSKADDITPKKLQKLVYYAESWNNALYDHPLISDSQFEAWAHGPVSKELYTRYHDYGWNPIPMESKPKVDNKTEDLLESVWLTYGDKSANELEALTHMEEPWRKARRGLKDGEHGERPINRLDMKEYYRSIYSGD